MQRIVWSKISRGVRQQLRSVSSITKAVPVRTHRLLPSTSAFCNHLASTPLCFVRSAGTATTTEPAVEKEKPRDARENEVLKSIPGSKTTNDVMIIVFTCKVCGTRAARKMSKEAYNHGVVLIRCPGCNNLHLIADHLGYFDDNSTNVEQILAQKGEKVMRMDDKQVLEFLHKEDLK